MIDVICLFSVTFSKGRGIWKCERKSNYQIRVALILWRAYLDQTESFCNYHPLCIGHQTFMLITTLLLLPIYEAPVWSQARLPLSPVRHIFVVHISSLIGKNLQSLPGTLSWAGCGHLHSYTLTSESGHSPPGPPSGSTQCPAPGRKYF